jgi:hypothetical protein
MTRIEVSRKAVGDPSSVALVLAGPAARELWPRRADRVAGVAGVDGVDGVDGVVKAQQPAASLAVDPPARSGVGFAARVQVQAGDRAVGTGRLNILPVSPDCCGCEIRLSLEVYDDAADRLRRDAAQYLANVADLSRERSCAA